MAKRKMKIETWDDAKTAMESYATLRCEVDKQKLLLDEAVRTAALTFGEATEKAARELDTLEKDLLKFAKAHPIDFTTAPDGDGRSFEHAGARLRARKLPDKVKIEGEEAAVEYLARFRPEYVRFAPSADRAALLVALQDGDTDLVRALGEHGISIDRGKDKFSVEVVKAALQRQ